MTALQTAKQILRKQIKARLNQMSLEEQIRQSNILTRMFIEHPKYEQSRRISIFLSMSDEIHTLGILKHALANNKQCFIPRYKTTGPIMEMIRLESLEDYEALPETAWKIKQPSNDELRENAMQSGGLDLVLMPGLGFTRSGDRIGRGRAYYDTYLTKYEGKFGEMPHTIALAYKEQICEDIPVDEHDRLINEVLFEDMDK